MDIEYIPNIGFILNSVKIKWNEERSSVREKIGNKHKQDDTTIDVDNFFDEDESMNINQKRDIYENLNSKNDILFLNYNKDNNLISIEVHCGFNILIKNILLDFGVEISDFIYQFQKDGIQYFEIEKGNYLMPTLKMMIADSESMGGNGTVLSYFYATSDISHLKE